jgi:glucosamine--fructose-6-phosphate aminotransferase (isomerizing)
MCGIVAAVAHRNIVPVLIEGLNKLEYRGYDSAGLAISGQEGLTRLRAVGRVAELSTQAQSHSAHLGIAHTRWATHGVPSERNAHPHICGGLAVVHNGIIENYAELKAELQASGYQFTLDSDTEVITHLIHQTLKHSPDLFDAVQHSTRCLIGAYAIAVLQEQSNRIIVARHGAPLLMAWQTMRTTPPPTSPPCCKSRAT